MMRISLAYFTDRGEALAQELMSQIQADWQPRRTGVKIGAWAREVFASTDVMLFIGSTGIAVRAIAPLVRDKLTDPAVIVMDDHARYVIPILSGHVGGANEAARLIAEAAGAIPVLTTATDLDHAFACDVWAKINHLGLHDHRAIAAVSAKALRGEKIAIASDIPADERRKPPHIFLTEDRERADIIVAGCRKNAIKVSESFVRDNTGLPLVLYPRNYVAGIGCRAGADSAKLRDRYLALLALCGISPDEISAIASIDRKRQEEALVDLRFDQHLSFLTYTAGELMAVEGTFQGSDFVRKTVGTDNVCERAAVCAAMDLGQCTSGDCKIVMPKNASDGMTFAIVQFPPALRWEEQTALQ